jgi:hypothetical protein
MMRAVADSLAASIEASAHNAGEGIARMRTLLAATIAATALLNDTARAQDAADALKTFGLIGIWSPDCTRNPKDALPSKPLSSYPVRWIYSIDNAEPKLTRMIHGLSAIDTQTYDIKAAKIIGPTKLKYSQVPTTIQFTTPSGPQTARPAEEMPSDVVVEMSADKMRVVSQVAANGTVAVENGTSTVGHGWDAVKLRNPGFERCSN